VKCFERYVEDSFDATVQRHGLFPEGTSILLCVSGEKDSTVMMHLAKQWRERTGSTSELSVLTVDEGISNYRGRCCDLVEKQAASLGLPVHRETFNKRYGTTLDLLSDERPGPAPVRICTFCCAMRGNIVREMAIRTKADAIAFGTNVDDAAEYGLVCLLDGRLDDVALPQRRLGVTGHRIVSPLIELTAFEIALYAWCREIEYLSEDCHHCGEHVHDDLKAAVHFLEDRLPGSMRRLASGYKDLIEAHFLKEDRVNGPLTESRPWASS
jgi:cytoplasmic tRNA 2-thiolation protein 1